MRLEKKFELEIWNGSFCDGGCKITKDDVVNQFKKKKNDDVDKKNK